MQTITDLVGVVEAFNYSSADSQLNAEHSLAASKVSSFMLCICVLK